MRPRLAGLALLVFGIPPLLGRGEMPLEEPLAGFVAAEPFDRHTGSTGRAALPMLSVHYFRGNGRESRALFVLDFPEEPRERSEAAARARRLSGRIRRLELGKPLASRGADVLIERAQWTSGPADPSVYRSRADLLPGHYRLELLHEYRGTSATIDRILEVPSFSDDQLGLSNLLAMSERGGLVVDATALSALSPKVDRRFRRGQAVLIFGEAYVPTSREGPTSLAVRFRLQRGARLVRGWTRELHPNEPRVPILERLDTSALDAGPYVLEAKASLPSGPTSASTRLELMIDVASP